MTNRFTMQKRALRGSTALAGLLGALAVAMPHNAKAATLYDGSQAGNGWEVDLTTTITWTPIWRVSGTNDKLAGVGNENGNDGDLNFAHGLVSDDFQILPILDIKNGDFGAHVSGEAYLNTSYLGRTQNDSPSTYNPISTDNAHFTSATRNAAGENARLLDAFVYDTVRFGAGQDQSATLKIGRQTLLWGQSLFLAGNGIAAGQAPIDAIVAQNTPNAQAQQIFLPVGQVVATYQPNEVWTFQAYYQFEYETYNLPAAGSYFSSSDVLDKGGQQLLFAPKGSFGPGVPTGITRIKNNTPPIENGQFGASVQLTLGNYDVGFYGLRFDSKTPTLYLQPGGPFGVKSYQLVYPRDIWIEGTSLSTTVGPANVAGELSFRQHMPLATGANVSLTDNVSSDPAYPYGNTVAGQVSAIYLSPGIPLDPGGVSASGEVGFNHVLSVSANDAAIDTAKGGTSTNRSSTAAQVQFVLTPQYSDVLPNLQLNFPIGVAYDFYGNSMVDSTENHGTGSVNFGIDATYDSVYTASLTYNRYIGRANPLFQGEPAVADRDYLIANLGYSF